MRIGSCTMGLSLPAIVLGLLCLFGCGQERADTGTVAASSEAGHQQVEEGHNLHGYWCVEHAVPEEICAQCSSKVAAEFQEKGDWCVEHSRPDSQCFICHPEFEEKFIAQYVAKFGEEPPSRAAE